MMMSTYIWIVYDYFQKKKNQFSYQILHKYHYTMNPRKIIEQQTKLLVRVQLKNIILPFKMDIFEEEPEARTVTAALMYAVSSLSIMLVNKYALSMFRFLAQLSLHYFKW